MCVDNPVVISLKADWANERQELYVIRAVTTLCVPEINKINKLGNPGTTSQARGRPKSTSRYLWPILTPTPSVTLCHASWYPQKYVTHLEPPDF